MKGSERSFLPRAVRRSVVVLIAFTAAILWTAGPAAAHNVLLSSDPADGAVMAKAPAVVTFTFDQPVENFDPEVVVTDPDGNAHPGTVIVSGNVVTGTMNTIIKGLYTAAYRVISADGHPVTGEVRFTITAGTPARSTSATPPAAVGDTGLSSWLWIGLGVAALLLIGALVVILRRPGEDDTEPAP